MIRIEKLDENLQTLNGGFELKRDIAHLRRSFWEALSSLQPGT